jgi:lipopolysaccharide transport system permease protein
MIGYLTATFRYKELLRHLVAADLKRKQKNTLLGFIWSFLNPLLTMGVYFFIFGVIFNSRFTIENYPLFLFWGLLPFRAGQTAISDSASSIIRNSRLIGNVAFPRLILPLTQVLSSGYELLMTLLVLTPLSLLLGGHIGRSVVLLPVVLLFQAVLVCGLALLAATLDSYFRDVENVLPHLMRMWFYLSPGVYTLDRVPHWFRHFYLINPYSVIMPAYRDLMMYGRVPDFSKWLVPTLITLLIFVTGLVVFWRQERNFPKLV